MGDIPYSLATRRGSCGRLRNSRVEQNQETYMLCL